MRVKWFIGKVVVPEDQKVVNEKKKKTHVRVCCLSLPFGVRIPQDLERENDAVDYKDVFECVERPQLIKVDRSWKWVY